MRWVLPFEKVSLADVSRVGGKNASIGQMIGSLKQLHIRVPDGFAITSDAYWYFLEANNIKDSIKNDLAQLHDINDIAQVQKVGKTVRDRIVRGHMPDDLKTEIAQAYVQLSKKYKTDQLDVAVRSSATAEDLPTASFAGQQESYLHVVGIDELVGSAISCFASLFTDRAIVYRVENGFSHMAVGLSVGVQKMVRSDMATSGVAFSLDPESGFPDVVTINASYGLGEAVVKGMVVPDEFVVHKPTLAQGYPSIISSKRGDKKIKIVYAQNADHTQTVPVDPQLQLQFSLADAEVLEIARAVVAIEKEYSAQAGAWKPMDVEWAKDGIDGLLYVVQARPETVHARASHTQMTTYHLNVAAQKPTILLTGYSIGQKIVSAPVQIIKSVHEMSGFKEGHILVADMTDPDWVPAMKRAAGIITNRGGRTCHAAIVSRELGIPALVGTLTATETLHADSMVTIDCSQGDRGFVYEGKQPFITETIDISKLQKPPVHLMVNIAQPDRAFSQAWMPVDGVGLARIEFIISNSIKIHPMALIHPEKVIDKQVKANIERVTSGYADKKEFFVQTLAQGVATIAAAFYPRPVIVRLSDFKSNEYRNLMGGIYFEPIEENPMLGFRGAFRYYHPAYQEAFGLECAAIERARQQFGLHNIKVMIPFVRSLDEAQKVVAELKENGLVRGKHALELVMMCEIPSNVILMKDFCAYFDGFSIGSNDLTQLILGVDRDSELLAQAFDERDPAVMRMIELAIEGAHQQKKYIGICGQAPSDYPEIAKHLIEFGIDSISLNADAVIPFLMRHTKN